MPVAPVVQFVPSISNSSKQGGGFKSPGGNIFSIVFVYDVPTALLRRERERWATSRDKKMKALQVEVERGDVFFLCDLG